MTLQPDPAVVLVHERLEQAVSAMRAPDVEAGWAALSALLDEPIAPVVPFRKPKRGRTVVLAVAAAMMLAGSAFAAVAHFGDGHTDRIAPSVRPVHAPTTGPHAHAPFAGPQRGSQPAGHHHGDGPGTDTVGATGSGSSSSGGSTTGSGDRGGSTSKPGDDPNDRDQGSGNDGPHNDHGGGNNGPEGSKPGTSSGSSHGGSHH